MSKIVHKFYRNLLKKAQFRICDDKRVDFAENVVYRWKGLRPVTCRKCLTKKGSRA